MAAPGAIVSATSHLSFSNLIEPAGTSAVQRYLDLRRDWVRPSVQSISVSERVNIMITSVKTFIVRAWNFVFDHRVSPLRHIPDVSVRHYILQVLGFMWAASFSIAIGSYTFLAASIVGHSVLIAAAAVTVATFTVAAKQPKFFMRGAGRRSDGEHE